MNRPNKFIYFSKRYNKYDVRSPSIKGKSLHLGSFNTVEEAIKHRDEFLELYEYLLNN